MHVNVVKTSGSSKLCMSYEEEDTCMSMLSKPVAAASCACHMRRRIHACQCCQNQWQQQAVHVI